MTVVNLEFGVASLGSRGYKGKIVWNVPCVNVEYKQNLC